MEARKAFDKRTRNTGDERSKNHLKVVSVFSGAGGLDIAFCRTGCVAELFSTDSNPIFLETVVQNLPRHFPHLHHTHFVSDARALTGDKVRGFSGPDIDLVHGGPPCDDFTKYGKRRGLRGDKGALVFEFARLVADLKPKVFLFENVPNLKQQFGKVLESLLSQFCLAGYDIKNSRILCAAAYGSPTKRKRLFVVGFRDPTWGRNFAFPAPTHGEGFGDLFSETLSLSPFVTVREVLSDLPNVGPEDQAGFMNHTGRNHRYGTIEHMKTVPQGVSISKSFRYRAPWNGLCRSLTAGVDHSTKSYIHPLYHREMSVREYARLHGFPDTWHFFGNHHNGIKQVANAVPLQLGEAVANAIVRTFHF
jgi:DNA (cytosine-5)-methyltransferase 1